MSSFSIPYTVPDNRPVPTPILDILAVVQRVATEQDWHIFRRLI